MKDEERVFRLVRRDGVIYWSGPYDHADQFLYGSPGEEVRHLSIADAFNAAEMDPIKRVVGQARAKEARFVAEHGVSSAEFFGESGVSDAQDEAMQKREEIE